MGDEPSWAEGRKKPPAWIGGEGRTRFDNPWLALVEYDATAPTGHQTHYGVIRFKKHAVGVVPLHADGTVTLVGQQRFPLANYVWEIPEGGLDPGEAPLEGARRELREETGLLAEHWREILKLELSNSVTDETGTCFLALGLSEGPTQPDATEALERVRVPFRALLQETLAGRIRDSMTVAAVFRTYHMACEGELPADLARAVLG